MEESMRIPVWVVKQGSNGETGYALTRRFADRPAYFDPPVTATPGFVNLGSESSDYLDLDIIAEDTWLPTTHPPKLLVAPLALTRTLVHTLSKLSPYRPSSGFVELIIPGSIFTASVARGSNPFELQKLMPLELQRVILPTYIFAPQEIVDHLVLKDSLPVPEIEGFSTPVLQPYTHRSFHQLPALVLGS